MANQSSASVTINAKASIAKELFEYIEAVQSDSEYNIINEDALVDIDYSDDPEAYVSVGGWATGRWSYSNNLESYFAGRFTKENWRVGEGKAAHLAYGKLVSAIKRKHGDFEIEYQDEEGGAGFIDVGTLSINEENIDDDVPSIDSQAQDYTISNMMEIFGYDEWEAIDNMYGDEVSTAWSEYKDANGAIEIADDFVSEYSSDIYDGNFDATEVVLEENRKAKEGEAIKTP